MAGPAPSVILPQPSRMRRWARRLRAFLLFCTVLVVTVYLTEQERGREAVAAAVAAFDEAGESLDPGQFRAAAPLKAENFGATPALDGLMVVTDEGKPPAPVAERQKRFAVFRTGYEILGPEGKSSRSSNRVRPERKPGSPRPEPEVVPMPEKTFPHTLPWDSIREDLFHRGGLLKPGPDEPVDVVAVDRALDEERLLFDELSVAAGRPYAVLTPAPADRPLFCQGSPFPDNAEFEWLTGLSGLLRVRIVAAAELGRAGEAARLTRVVWKIREALVSEHSMVPDFSKVWRRCVMDTMRSPGADDDVLRALQQQIPAGWSAESELLAANRYYAMWLNLFWQRAADSAEWQFSGDFDGAFRGTTYSFFFRFVDDTRFAMNCPSGWLRLTGAAALEDKLNYAILPLRTMDLSRLPVLEQPESSGRRPNSSWLSPVNLFSFWPGAVSDCRYDVEGLMCVRLTQVSMAVERWRRRHGRYPGSAGELVPEFLPDVPKDVDGQPVRVFSADGSKAVIYSVGWNRTDDWHGDIPGSAGEMSDSANRSDDWFMKLPLPPYPAH